VYLPLGDQGGGGADFEEAKVVAHASGSKAHELRVNTTLALRAKPGIAAKARAVLAEIYSWFTEGFDTADLKDARFCWTSWAVRPEPALWSPSKFNFGAKPGSRPYREKAVGAFCFEAHAASASRDIINAGPVRLGEIEAMPAAKAVLRTADQCWTSPIRTFAAPRSRPSATDSCQTHVVRTER
jgi:hypothetical protein